MNYREQSLKQHGYVITEKGEWTMITNGEYSGKGTNHETVINEAYEYLLQEYESENSFD